MIHLYLAKNLQLLYEREYNETIGMYGKYTHTQAKRVLASRKKEIEQTIAALAKFEAFKTIQSEASLTLFKSTELALDKLKQELWDYEGELSYKTPEKLDEALAGAREALVKTSPGSYEEMLYLKKERMILKEIKRRKKILRKMLKTE